MAHFAVVLPNGKRLDDESVAGVVNRLTWIAPASLVMAEPEDREYAAQELFALLLSWLHGLRAPVINRPAPSGLGGRLRYPAEWQVLAARAGIPTGSSHLSLPQPAAIHATERRPLSAVRRVYVVGPEVINAPDLGPVLEACRRLASIAGTELLGIDLRFEDGHWIFGGASPLADVVDGGAALLDALAGLLVKVPANR